MIEGFEEFTFELDDEEKAIAEALAEAFTHNHVGLKNALSSSSIIKMFKVSGTTLHGHRIRKMVQYIRVKNLCPMLCASQKGYYVAKDKEEFDVYIESLRQRIRSTQFTLAALTHFEIYNSLMELSKEPLVGQLESGIRLTPEAHELLQQQFKNLTGK